MATRSSISIRNEDGSYTGIYCHWDGYLSNNGRILAENYTSEDKIRQLLALGSISSLGAEIGEKHAFSNPNKYGSDEYRAWEEAHSNWCTAYGRDRGEKNTAAVTKRTVLELLDKIGQEYDYLWYDGKWHVRCYATGTRFVTLDEARAMQGEDA
jgi:hypothetical protein